MTFRDLTIYCEFENFNVSAHFTRKHNLNGNKVVLQVF